jgi:hypothetical protein
MKCKIHTYLLNDLYSQDYADANHGGKQSEDNLKYEWEDELEISTSVSKVSELKNEVYTLAGTLGDVSAFSYPISEMRLVKIDSNDAQSFFIGASESILKELVIKEKGDSITIEIFLKDYEPLSNPVPGIYIGSKSFPRELIF